MFSADITYYVTSHFRPEDCDEVMRLLRKAVCCDGKKATPRLLRCVLVGSGDNLDGLRQMLDLLRLDHRDVIMIGEYALQDGDPVRLRDLSSPFD